MNATEIIKKHGGSAALARKLTALRNEEFSRQRVNAWKKRVIPDNLLLDHPKLFKGYVRK